MREIIRSKEQMQALLEALQRELDDPNIIYGKEDSVQWIDELTTAIKHGTVVDEWSEIGYWLTRQESYFGSDYGVE